MRDRDGNFEGDKSTWQPSFGYEQVEGVWYVDTIGAPFLPHGFVFLPGGILLVTFPDAAERANSASVGTGDWRKDDRVIVGSFFEINADKETSQFTSLLVVTFLIRVKGDRFEGPAEANYYDKDRVLVDGPFPATLKGQRFATGKALPDPTG